MSDSNDRSSRTRTAAVLSYRAGRERKYAAAGGPSAAADLAEAERLDFEAAALLKPLQPLVIRSGEVIRSADEHNPPWELRKTLTNPDQTAIDASVMRTALLLEQPDDTVALAIDAAVSAGAKTPLEQMLVHQLAVLHPLVMKAVKWAHEFAKPDQYGRFAPTQSIEFARLTNTAARMTAAFQDGMLTLLAIRRGARQTVRVEHVTIAAGAQAVIGNLTTRGKRQPSKRRGRGAK